MMKSNAISLGAFIESVKREILDYQKKHEGERALFLFEKVELEASLGTTVDAQGRVNVFAIQFGADAEKACTHTVRMRFSLVDAEVAEKASTDSLSSPTVGGRTACTPVTLGSVGLLGPPTLERDASLESSAGGARISQYSRMGVVEADRPDEHREKKRERKKRRKRGKK